MQFKVFLILVLVGIVAISCAHPIVPQGKDWPAMEVRVDTLISIHGDTILYRKPYKPTTLEKAGFVATGIFALWMIQWNEEHNRSP